MARKALSHREYLEILSRMKAADTLQEKLKIQNVPITSSFIRTELLGTTGFPDDAYMGGYKKILNAYSEHLREGIKELQIAASNIADPDIERQSIQRALRRLSQAGVDALYPSVLKAELDGGKSLQNQLLYLLTRENLDLDLIAGSTSSVNTPRGALLDQFRIHGLRMSISDFENMGLPGDLYPSQNKYTFLARYRHDISGDLPRFNPLVDSVMPGPSQGIHPLVLQMMRANYNIKNHAESISDITVAVGKMRNPFSLQLLMERTKQMKLKDIPDTAIPGSDEIPKPRTTLMNIMGFTNEDYSSGRTFRIRTFDEETSGLR